MLRAPGSLQRVSFLDRHRQHPVGSFESNLVSSHHSSFALLLIPPHPTTEKGTGDISAHTLMLVGKEGPSQEHSWDFLRSNSVPIESPILSLFWSNSKQRDLFELPRRYCFSLPVLFSHHRRPHCPGRGWAVFLLTVLCS